MKKNLIYTLAFATVISLISSCAKEENNPVVEQGKQITISASFPEDATKVVFTGSDEKNAIALKWEAGDVITITATDNSSNTQTFTLASGAGTKQATFTGTALAPATSYNISYGAAGTYAVQTQAKNGDASHVNFKASLSGVTDYTNFTFSKAWATANGATYIPSAVLRLRAQIPNGTPDLFGEVKSVVFKASAPIFAGADEMKVNITKSEDDYELGYLTIYASLPGEQTIAAGTKLWISFQTDAEKAYKKYTAYRELGSTPIKAGQVNTLSLDCSNIDRFAGKEDDGTSAHPYLIADQNQMLAMSSQLSSEATVYFKLIDDIDMTGTDWSPLNPDSPYNLKVNFDGNNKTVSHLGGTMFYVFKGSIKNLTLDAPTISTGNQKGGFAQYIQGTDNYVTNVDVCNVATFEAASGNCGGLIGRINNGETGKTSATIVECDVTNVPVNSTGTAGGLIGYVEGVKVVISNCNVTGNTVSTTNHYAGGLIARAAGEVVVSNCHTNMVVSATGKYRIGGLIGWAETGSVEQCYAEGNISGAQYMGGLIGTVSNTAGDSFSISKSCYITGSITPTKNINGGLVGSKEGAGSLSIRNCYSSASIIASGPQRAGGILGNHYAGTSTLENCYFSGRIEINACIGGIVGWVETSGLSVTRCMPFPASLHATQNVADAERYCSGLVVGYANKSNTPTMIVNHCYRTAAIASNFQDYTGVATINVVEDHDFITTAAAIPQRHGLTYGFYHHGKQTDSANLSALVQRSDIGGAWDSSIWNFEQDYPRLNWMLP